MIIVALSMMAVAIGASYQASRHIVQKTKTELTKRCNQQMDMLESIVLATSFAEKKSGRNFGFEELVNILGKFNYGPDVSQVSFRETSDVAAFNQDITIKLEAPLFFSRWCGHYTIKFNRPIIIQGEYYGLLTLSMSPNRFINEAWENYEYLLQVILISLLIVLSIIWVVLRKSLRPLRTLAKASKSLAKGNLSIRVPVIGSPELRTVIVTFNQMASSFQSTLTALQESEEKYRTILQTMEEGYYEIDLAGNVTFVNDAMCRIMGSPKVELIGINYCQYISPETAKEVHEVFNKIYATGEPVRSHEWDIIRPDNTKIYIESSIATARSSENQATGFRGVVIDITERKQAEAEKETLQAQFLQAQKIESIGQLAGGVAHDYNNISTVIIGNAEIALQKVDENDPLHEDLVEILTAAKRATDITKQLLAFARKQTIAPKVLDLNVFIQNMIKMLRLLIGEDIDLAWLPGEKVWSVKIDPSQIDQIMANLCGNARDAISDIGKVTIETRNISFDEDYCADHAGFVPGEYVLLAVSDNGCGIAQETLDKIFEPFFTTKSIGYGTGMGLATVYGIVKQNNGFINVYSEPNKGTTIKVYLPRHTGQAVDTYSENTLEIPLSRGETVLIVEDDISILKLGKRILEYLGYAVLSTNSPSEAMKLAEEYAGKINLLITDVVMPEMNGRELSKQLQSLYPDLKILFMSGYTANVIAHRGVLEDGVSFMLKPFSHNDMAFKIRETLDEAKS